MKKLGNPALIAQAVSNSEVAKQTASVIPFVIKTAIVCGIAWYAYHRFTNRFVKLKEKSNYPTSNVTDAQAKSRADAISGSIDWFSNSFDTVADSLAGLNYNGFVKVYNAFGHQTGTLLGGDLNLVEWIRNQFTDYEIAQLSALQNGAFFRIANTPKIIAMNNFLSQFTNDEANEFLQQLAV